MPILKMKIKRAGFLVGTILTILFIIYVYLFLSIPDELILLEGKEYIYHFQDILPIKIGTDNNNTIHIKRKEEQQLNSKYMNISNPILLKTNNKGSFSLHVSIFGLIPIKTVKADVIPNVNIIACGNTVGIKLKLDGILVIGVSEVETLSGKKILPVKETGIKPGDFIIKVNGKNMGDINDLIYEINSSKGEKIDIQYRRGEEYCNIFVKPVISMDDKQYHIGLWVRDNTAGIGTLTYYDPDTLCFGSLGHGITDADTGALMSIKWGEILDANILAVKKSENGMPGELKGILDEEKNKFGVVYINSNYGIYGKLYNPILDIDTKSKRQYPIAVKSQIREGSATILANILGKQINEYNIEIQKISLKNTNGSKGMVIKIVDERLLEATGGIVQGMSGSPIIQDGRIVGAVTHVLVNDPTKGYGIFIECMIKKMQENSAINMKKTG
jgi:stage IV sporulation protein B